LTGNKGRAWELREYYGRNERFGGGRGNWLIFKVLILHSHEEGEFRSEIYINNV
jgi:hypothetical protein